MIHKEPLSNGSKTGWKFCGKNLLKRFRTTKAIASSTRGPEMAARWLPCACCHQLAAQLNDYNLCPECEVCQHCDTETAVTTLGLCETCDADKDIRRLYAHKSDWTPEREAQLRFLTRIHQTNLIKEEIEHGSECD